MNPEQTTRVLEALGRIEQKIDGHMAADLEKFARHETAINNLFSKANEQDKFRARMRGGMTVMASVVTAAGAAFGFIINKLW
jgi:hypothetical protein